MKLSDKLKEKLLSQKADPESSHAVFDNAMRDRLMELDPEWMTELDNFTEDFTFWYA